jgi:hypothetical protein
MAPRSRPRGKRAWLWLLHAAWIYAALIGVYSTQWSKTPDAWRCVIVVVIAYTAVAMPITIIQVLRIYWNASSAAKQNRRLLGIAGSQPPGYSRLTEAGAVEDRER